ncbi:MULTISPECIES: hypothetical protein [unclassified Rhizobium]|uniref:hypothetical protein n=1 Tax=unclassified Rhizobium TaxID=2613769 RepID=UPI00117A228A|nr:MULTISPECIES: hypothetical protein [unclassified Rhizobium]MDQ4405396.1 hypothetical protein [Rhizobium sp. AN63]
MIEKIVLRPGPQRGKIDAILYGELSTILNWIQRQAIGRIAQTKKSRSKGYGSVGIIGCGGRI